LAENSSLVSHCNWVASRDSLSLPLTADGKATQLSHGDISQKEKLCLEVHFYLFVTANLEKQTYPAADFSDYSLKCIRWVAVGRREGQSCPWGCEKSQRCTTSFSAQGTRSRKAPTASLCSQLLLAITSTAIQANRMFFVSPRF